MVKNRIFFCLHLPPPIHGAAVIGDYIKSSDLINQSFDCTYINLSTSQSVREIGKSSISKWIRYFNILARVIYQVLIKRPDLVYITLNSHGMGLIKDAGIVMICRFIGLPHVFHFHNKGVKKFSETRAGKLLYPFVFKKAQVILLSPLLYSDFQDFVSFSKVQFCSNGIPEMGFSPKSKWKSNEQSVRLLFLSNLVKNKGIYDLLEACRLLSEFGVIYNLTLAGGEGDLSLEELNEVISHYGLESSIKYIGKVHGGLKKLILEEADIFVLPTHEDCFPLVLLEALQASLPIVTTYEGAIPEIVEQDVNGLIVPAKNPELLAKAIFKLCKNPDMRSEFGIAGRLKFDQKYTLEKFENRFLQVIDKVLFTNR